MRPSVPSQSHRSKSPPEVLPRRQVLRKHRPEEKRLFPSYAAISAAIGVPNWPHQNDGWVWLSCPRMFAKCYSAVLPLLVLNLAVPTPLGSEPLKG